MTIRPGSERLLVAALLVATAALFSPVLGAPFVYDDHLLILDQPHLHGLGQWKRWFTEPYWPALFNQGLYRPLTTATFGLTWALAGPSPVVFHATNLVLHLLVTALVWWTGRRIGLSPLAALLAALLFAVHPVHVEVTAAIANRGDALATAAALLALGLWLGRCAHALGRGQVIGALGCFALALGSKESGMLLLPLLVVAEVVLRPVRWREAAARRRLIVAAVGAATLTALYVAVKVQVCGGFGVPAQSTLYPDPSLPGRLVITGPALAAYLRLLVWPMTLAADYQWTPPEATALRVAVNVAALGVFTLGGLAAALALRRRWPRIAFSLLWAGLGLSLYVHVVPIGALLAERFAHLSSVGVCWCAGATWDAVRRRVKAPLLVGLLLLATLFAGRSLRHALAWREPERLWATTVEVSPGSFRGWFNLGQTRLGRGDVPGAVEALRQALAVKPESVLTRQSLADAAMRLGRPAEAERLLREALEIDPTNADTLSTLALVLADEGRAREAVAVIEERGLAVRRESPRMWYNVAVVRLAVGDRRGAREALERAEAMGYADRARLAEVRRRLAE